jgi:ribonuclease HII
VELAGRRARGSACHRCIDRQATLRKPVERQRLRKMLRFETSLWESGCHAVAGVDEAGMSPLAGPVSASAVILKPGTRIIGVDDSKKLDPTAREEFAKEIREKAASWCVTFVEVEEIDVINIYWAGIQAMQRAVRGLGAMLQHLLIDAKRLKEIDLPQQAIIKGDAKSASIRAMPDRCAPTTAISIVSFEAAEFGVGIRCEVASKSGIGLQIGVTMRPSGWRRVDKH